MISYLTKFLVWLLKRVLAGCVIAAFGLAAWVWWLHKHDDEGFLRRRAREVASLSAVRDQIVAARATADKHVDEIVAELNAEQKKVSDAERAIELHKSIESDWKRWTGGREEQELNDRRREEQEKAKGAASERVAVLKQELAGVIMTQQHAEVAQARAEKRIAAMEIETSEWKFYARLVWEEKNGMCWACWFVGFWVVWPFVRRLALYYFVAPFVIRRRPLKLAKRADVTPALGEEGRAVTVELWPGELLCAKEALVESADEGLSRGKRFWLKGRFPITNAACGLTRLAELRNTHAGEVRRVVLRGAGKWTGAGRDVRGRRAELAIVQVPEGGSLVLRPRYLAGVVRAGDAPLMIRSHWRFFSWHAWVTGQFRFLEFAGPCRLIVACQRGVQAETLEPREDGRRPVRRANVWATIGFTPALAYRPARAESFWSYCRGGSPLYDDLFIGTGMFFVQKTAIGQGRYDKGLVRQFVAGCWRGFQKIFGM